mgnify:CR=1 FL=1
MSIWNLKAGKSSVEFKVTTKSREELLAVLREGRKSVKKPRKPRIRIIRQLD